MKFKRMVAAIPILILIVHLFWAQLHDAPESDAQALNGVPLGVQIPDVSYDSLRSSTIAISGHTSDSSASKALHKQNDSGNKNKRLSQKVSSASR